MRPSGKAKVAGVIGWPVAHSKSPLLHGFWLDQLRIDGAYVPLAVRPADLSKVLPALPKMGFTGVNITVPHKQAAIELVDRLTPTARRAGAVNTVTIGEDGTLTGDSTDGYGFIAYLQERAPDFEYGEGPAVVLGSGGAARSIAAALVDRGVPELRLICRSPEAGEQLAAAIGGPIIVQPWTRAVSALSGAQLLVNATTLGMAGQAPLLLPLDELPREAVVYDIVYAPLATDLLADAGRRGYRTIDGLGMLIHQARPAFAAFFGTLPEPNAELRALLTA